MSILLSLVSFTCIKTCIALRILNSHRKRISSKTCIKHTRLVSNVVSPYLCEYLALRYLLVLFWGVFKIDSQKYTYLVHYSMKDFIILVTLGYFQRCSKLDLNQQFSRLVLKHVRYLRYHLIVNSSNKYKEYKTQAMYLHPSEENLDSIKDIQHYLIQILIEGSFT